MKKFIHYFGHDFPFTGRAIPLDARMDITVVHPKWADLIWRRGDDRVYISTLPIEVVSKSDISS